MIVEPIDFGGDGNGLLDEDVLDAQGAQRFSSNSTEMLLKGVNDPREQPSRARFWQGFHTSSIVLVALTIFVVALCVVPTVKGLLDRRDRRKRMKILNGSSPLENLLQLYPKSAEGNRM
jgi:hypothetical protein